MPGYPDTIDRVGAASDVSVGTIPPTNTYNGLHWMDSNKSPPELNIWINGSWYPVGGSANAGVAPSLVAPVNPNIGQQWFDLAANLVKIYGGPANGWMNVVTSTTLNTAVAAAMASEIARTAADYVDSTGDSMTGPLVLPTDPVNPLEAATKQYVDAQITTTTTAAGANPVILTAIDTKITTERAYTDTTYETKAAHATDKAAEITRADAKYVPKSQLATVSTGAPTAARVVETDSNGKIDISFLNIPGGMAYKGSLAATAPAPATPAAGDFYVFSSAGTPTGWTGIAAPVKANEAALFDGTKWDVLASGTDISATYDKTSADAKFYTLAAQALDRATQTTINAALTKADSDELARAQAAELVLTNALAAEVTRADTAEKANAALIAALTTRVAALETAMAGKVAKVGDTMTGALIVQSTIRATGEISSAGDITAFKP